MADGAAGNDRCEDSLLISGMSKVTDLFLYTIGYVETVLIDFIRAPISDNFSVCYFRKWLVVSEVRVSDEIWFAIDDFAVPKAETVTPLVVLSVLADD